MNFWIVIAWIVTVGSVTGLAAALAWTLLHPRSASHKSPESTDVASSFSFARYKVMERLLASQDERFLSTQDGFSPEAAARWKRDSLRIFRMYLRGLTRDFLTLHVHARQLVAASHSPSPALASTLVWQQAAFWRTRILLEGRLLLYRFGLGSVDAAPLLEMMEAMRVDLFRLLPEPTQAL